MMTGSHSKVVSKFEAGENIASVKEPFKLVKEQRRRYIRLEISRPVRFSVLKDNSAGFWPDGDGPSCDGSILNISAGGVLIVADGAVEEGTVIVMRMSLQEVEVLDNVIGLVKRVEAEGGEYLIGIEFVTREFLNDVFTQGQLEVIPQELASFDELIKRVLNKYIYYRRVSNEEAGRE
jgi:c-di-GMP-binding flagellar brake protein YcgR